MKVLIDHNEPFLLAHGGLQLQIERTKTALENSGLDVEYLRWWDEAQRGDLIHFFGRANPSQIDFAHTKGIKYVMLELLTSQGSRSVTHLRLQAAANRMLRKILPAHHRLPLRWDSYQKADIVIANTEWEAWMMHELFDAPARAIHVIPNAVADVFFRTGPRTSDGHLVYVGTITERKRVLELAQAAVIAQTPLKVIGRPYSEDDAYFLRFLAAIRSSRGIVEYVGSISNPEHLAAHLHAARGFVLPSTMETQSLAALEAAAAGLPLLLSDLPWARYTFAGQASYLTGSVGQSFASELRHFFDEAPRLPKPLKPLRWSDVGLKLKSIYSNLCFKPPENRVQ